ncbi:DTW domain-containing protein [Entomortierella parvispora]|uniref:tRNA-uridine aminocarboxypropyltransferase n=1 Tax=Entomortierella parvispora TaxID=205924 RepID=A0A9P3LU65_9FUNG|nr:DTW domain-containing protein [Entomortierella parvispora]
MPPSESDTPCPRPGTQLMDLPDSILLRIFEFVANAQEPVLADQEPPSAATTKNKKKRRVAGLGARSLCRLCCCSHRLNHVASADQLWQPLTLSRFSDRHWPTTDQKALQTIEVRREHQKKLLRPASTPLSEDTSRQGDSTKDRLNSQPPCETTPSRKRDFDACEDKDEDTNSKDDSIHGASAEDRSRKKPEQKKFYSRFEQRAHRRRFASLDPELRYTPLAWTNTFWSWKRTFFGDCRFVEAKDVQTPNRIDHAVHRNNSEAARQECGRCWRPLRSCICSALTKELYCNCRVRVMILQHPRCQVSIGTIRILKTSFKYCQIVIGKDFKAGRSLELDQALEDPNCTPLLLYPSHNAIDIQTIVSQIAEEPNAASHRYSCKGCSHSSEDNRSGIMDGKQDAAALETPSPYPYKLVIALDGSWSHAKIMYRCNPRLQQITQIKFPNPPQSIYHELKPEPKTTYTSTAEAVGQAVALLGWPGDKDNADLLVEDLIRPLKKMIEIQDTIAAVEQEETPSSQKEPTP